MIDTTNFIVRSSGRMDGHYYIDYVGQYRAADVAKATRVDFEKLNAIYLANGGMLDKALDIYYFDNMISAQKTISDIFSNMNKTSIGRVVTLTNQEIDYIRNALINETGFAGINNKIKDEIFKKLNG